MEIVWSDHALRQVHERNLSKAAIEQAVRNPDRLIRQSPRRYLATRTIRRNGKKYLLVVVFDARGERTELVTAFITSKITKYL